MARRSAPRRGKRGQRFTPRRWLPFALALAAVAALVVASGDGAGPPSTAVRVPAAARLPVASEPDAVSSAYYCAGGTAAGSPGAAELSVLIANAEPRGTTAEVTIYGSTGRRRTVTVAVPARGTANVVAREHLVASWAAMTVEVLGGRVTVEREVHGDDGYDTTPCSARAATRWYVPSGATVRGSEAYLALFNPFPDDTSVDITFATDTGSRTPRELQGLTVPAGSIRMVDVNTYVARRSQVATTVVARSGRVVVDRVQHDDGTGDAMVGQGRNPVRTGPPRGVVSTAAIPRLSSRWVVPHVRLTEGSRPQIALYNPGGATARVTVDIGYEQPDLHPPVEPIEVAVRSGEQRIVDLTEVSGLEVDTPFQVEVSSSPQRPLAAELLLYRASPSPSVGLTVMPASPVAATRWFLGSEGSGIRRRATVIVTNPWAGSVTVRVDELVKGARTTLRSATVRIPGRDRRVLELEAGTRGAPLIIRADRGVVVQRAAQSRTGLGISFSLGTPFPETVVELP